MSRRQKTRQQNLKTLLVESGMKKKEFAADVLDCTPSYFSQLIRPTKPKPINDKYAAKAEGYFGRPIGWLDWPPDYVPNEVRDGDIPEYVRRRFAGLPEEQQQRVLRAIDDVITLAEGADFRPQDTVVWRNIKRVDEGREPKKKAKAHRRKK